MVYSFGGHPVKIEGEGDSAILYCKGINGRLSEIEDYLNQTRYPSNHYPFGEKCLIEQEGEMIRIACLKDTRNKVAAMIADYRKSTEVDNLLDQLF
jgi:hypothetical protein